MKALVFGGRSPIALALCRQLAHCGSRVHLVTRRIDDAMKSAAESASVSSLHELDLAQSDVCVQFMQAFDSQHDPVSQVAFLHRYRGSDPDQIMQHQVEVLTPAAVLRQLAHRVHSPSCAVLLTTSPASRVVVGDQKFSYHASKAATSQLVRYAAVSYAKMGIRVNGLCPGSFVYKERAAEYYAKNPEILSRVQRLVPAGRMASVDEIASVGAFLLSSMSGYMYGQILEVDGGVGLLDPATTREGS